MDSETLERARHAIPLRNNPDEGLTRLAEAGRHGPLPTRGKGSEIIPLLVEELANDPFAMDWLWRKIALGEPDALTLVAMVHAHADSSHFPGYGALYEKHPNQIFLWALTRTQNPWLLALFDRICARGIDLLRYKPTPLLLAVQHGNMPATKTLMRLTDFQGRRISFQAPAFKEIEGLGDKNQKRCNGKVLAAIRARKAKKAIPAHLNVPDVEAIAREALLEQVRAKKKAGIETSMEAEVYLQLEEKEAVSALVKTHRAGVVLPTRAELIVENERLQEEVNTLRLALSSLIPEASITPKQGRV